MLTEKQTRNISWISKNLSMQIQVKTFCTMKPWILPLQDRKVVEECRTPPGRKKLFNDSQFQPLNLTWHDKYGRGWNSQVKISSLTWPAVSQRFRLIGCLTPLLSTLKRHKSPQMTRPKRQIKGNNIKTVAYIRLPRIRGNVPKIPFLKPTYAMKTFGTF